MKKKFIAIDDQHSNLTMSLNLISSTRYQIDIFSNHLNTSILGTKEISDALINFIKISHRSRLRILVIEPTSIVTKGHRLVELARRFSSFIELREVIQEYKSSSFSFLLADQESMLYRPISSQWEARLILNQKRLCHERQQFFDHIWQHSTHLNELRQLHI